MDQADSVHSTPPINTPIVGATSRRNFLTTAAGIAAGGTGLALVIPAARAADDPVFPLIEAHKATAAAVNLACAEQSRLEGVGDWDSDGGTGAAHDAEWQALADLVECVPTTVAGVIASLEYVRELTERGRHDDDFTAVLLANLACALEVAS
jgi:hypothetical protein